MVGELWWKLFSYGSLYKTMQYTVTLCVNVMHRSFCESRLHVVLPVFDASRSSSVFSRRRDDTSSRRAKFLRRCVVERARHGAQPSKRNRELPKTSVGKNG